MVLNAKGLSYQDIMQVISLSACGMLNDSKELV